MMPPLLSENLEAIASIRASNNAKKLYYAYTYDKTGNLIRSAYGNQQVDLRWNAYGRSLVPNKRRERINKPPTSATAPTKTAGVRSAAGKRVVPSRITPSITTCATPRGILEREGND